MIVANLRPGMVFSLDNGIHVYFIVSSHVVGDDKPVVRQGIYANELIIFVAAGTYERLL